MEYIISEEYKTVRLDKFLRKHLPNIPLTEIFKGIRVGKIKVNGKKSKENYRLNLGDNVKILFNPPLEQSKNIIKFQEKDLQFIKKQIIYEDDKILIFNKKANMVMHKGSNYEYGISELIKSYLKNDNFTFVNRIDKSTSGLIIGSKSLVTTRELSQEIRERKIDKKYFILVAGVVKKENFCIKNYLKKVEDRVIVVQEDEKDAKESISYFSVLKYGKDCTLLEATLDSGRTHQLRVQLSEIGHPILGDHKYGKFRESEMFLFSHYVNIPKYNIRINLEIPKNFINRLNKI